MPPNVRARHLSPSDASAVVDVLSDAFADYPVMRYVLGAAGAGNNRIQTLIGFFVFRRIQLGGPMLGIAGPDGQLAGAAVMTLPEEPEPSAAVLDARDRTWALLGDDCRERHDAYGAVAKQFLVTERHHHLNMIGIRHAAQGQGLARPLLEAVLAVAANDSSSGGVSLSTELSKNVRLYEHFGFSVVGHAPVTPAFDTWGLFRRTGARPPSPPVGMEPNGAAR